VVSAIEYSTATKKLLLLQQQRRVGRKGMKKVHWHTLQPSILPSLAIPVKSGRRCILPWCQSTLQCGLSTAKAVKHPSIIFCQIVWGSIRELSLITGAPKFAVKWLWWCRGVTLKVMEELLQLHMTHTKLDLLSAIPKMLPSKMVECQSSGWASSAPYDAYKILWFCQIRPILLSTRAATFDMHDGPKSRCALLNEKQ